MLLSIFVEILFKINIYISLAERHIETDGKIFSKSQICYCDHQKSMCVLSALRLSQLVKQGSLVFI